MPADLNLADKAETEPPYEAGVPQLSEAIQGLQVQGGRSPSLYLDGEAVRSAPLGTSRNRPLMHY